MPVSDFVPAEAVADPHTLELEFKINGETKQKESTALMIFTIPVLIEYISKYMTLKEGDLICTGTPAGVGPIKAGDTLEGALRQDGKELATLLHKVDK